MSLDKFAAILFFIGLIMATIFWLPNRLGLDFENSMFCLGAAFVAAVVIVIRAGIHRS
ncbi:MAG TPA: hypothetical protein PKE20_06380 [Promineifilum sp.]|nr:hypothetical protein [Promineifilum sp.]